MLFGKAQLRITESIIMIFLFCILFTLGLIFYTNHLTSSIEQMKTEQKQIQTLLLLSIVTNSPEFQCTFNNVPNTICLDYEKLENFINLFNEDEKFKDFYKKLFKDAEFTIEPITTYSNLEKLTFYDQLTTEHFFVYKVPISIYYNNKYQIAMLSVKR